MKISCIQMNMKFAAPNDNFKTASSLIAKAAQNSDTVVLPETWNTGFFPKEKLSVLCDRDGNRTKKEIGKLAKNFNVNIIAGSVSNIKNNKVYNTCYIFDRTGKTVGEYDKTHLFTYMNEHLFYEKGSSFCKFTLDGILCGVIVCYDLRFPEISRSLAVSGLDILFVVSQWPAERISQLKILAKARAVENQMFLVCCNSCGKNEKTQFGGNSLIIDPNGNVLTMAGENEEIISASCNTDILFEIRHTINIFSDRRPELYS